MSLEKYKHNNKIVAVKTEYKGKHQDICICHQCPLFKPNNPDNCNFAEMAFAMSKEIGLVLVMECKILARWL